MHLLKKLSFFLFLLANTALLTAQTAADWQGKWDGAIEVPGMKLELNVELSQADNTWKGNLDIPVQRILDMNLDELKIEGSTISFRLTQVPGNASFKGNISDDRTKINGDFSQGGGTFPMNLLKEDAAKKAEAAARIAVAIDKIRHLADSLRQLVKVPGLGFGIVKDGKVLLAEGFGYKNLESKAPVTAKTQFAIGSSSKAFTTMCLGMLSDEGKLDWKKPVVEYMPDFKLYDEFASKEMTARDLVIHNSGLPRHDFLWYGSSLSRQEMYQRLQYLEPSESFRTTFQYQNLMYMTAGILVEKLSGKTWEAFVKEHIFQPLGMGNSNLSVIDMQKAPDYALPYQKTKQEEIKKMNFRNIDAVGPAGSINSSVEDMLKWVQLQLDPGKVGGRELIGKNEVLSMHSPHFIVSGPLAARLNTFGVQDPNYGLGWFTYTYRGTRIVQHGGNIDGFSALVFLVPEENLGMVLLTNLNGNSLGSILAHTSTDLFIGREPNDWYANIYGKDKKEEEDEKKEPEKKRVEGTQPHLALAAYAGTYNHPGYGDMEIALENDQLVLKYNGIHIPLSHWHYETFAGKIEDLDIDSKATFYINQDGKIESLSTSMDAAVPDVVFKKVPPARLSDPAFLATLTGDYDLKGTTCAVSLNGKTLVVTIPGQPPYDLEPYDGNEFKLKALSGYSAEFFFDEKGRVKEMKFNQPNGVFTAVKK